MTRGLRVSPPRSRRSWESRRGRFPEAGGSSTSSPTGACSSRSTRRDASRKRTRSSRSSA